LPAREDRATGNDVLDSLPCLGVFAAGLVLVRLPFRMVLECEIRIRGREASGGRVCAGRADG
jgi:hypothetical protein